MAIIKFLTHSGIIKARPIFLDIWMCLMAPAASSGHQHQDNLLKRPVSNEVTISDINSWKPARRYFFSALVNCMETLLFHGGFTLAFRVKLNKNLLLNAKNVHRCEGTVFIIKRNCLKTVNIFHSSVYNVYTCFDVPCLLHLLQLRSQMVNLIEFKKHLS